MRFLVVLISYLVDKTPRVKITVIFGIFLRHIITTESEQLLVITVDRESTFGLQFNTELYC